MRERRRGVNERPRSAEGSAKTRRPATVPGRSCKTPVGPAASSIYTSPTPPLAPGLPATHLEVPLKLVPTLRLLATVALLAALPSLAAAAGPKSTPPAATGGSGALTLLYGDDHVFGIVPPAGWTVDDTSGLGSRIRVVLYPKGQKWSSAQTVMYVNPLHQQEGRTATLAQMIDRDVRSFMQKSPKGRVTVQKSLPTAKDRTAEVRYFAPDGRDPVEAVAYVAEDGLVMLLVLSSRDAAGFKRSVPAFESLVAGYQFVAGNVQTPR